MVAVGWELHDLENILHLATLWKQDCPLLGEGRKSDAGDQSCIPVFNVTLKDKDIGNGAGQTERRIMYHCDLKILVRANIMP